MKIISKKAWKLLSKLIRLRDSDKNGFITCCSCGRKVHWKESDAGHFIPKGTGAKGKSLEFHEKNIHAQCRYCNRNKGYNRAQVELIKANYSRFMVSKYGATIFDELAMCQQKVKPYKVYDYQALIKDYEKRLKEYDN